MRQPRYWSRKGPDSQAGPAKTMQRERDAAAAAVKQAESDIDRLVAAEYAQNNSPCRGLVPDVPPTPGTSMSTTASSSAAAG